MDKSHGNIYKRTVDNLIHSTMKYRTNNSCMKNTAVFIEIIMKFQLGIIIISCFKIDIYL